MGITRSHWLLVCAGLSLSVAVMAQATPAAALDGQGQSALSANRADAKAKKSTKKKKKSTKKKKKKSTKKKATKSARKKKKSTRKSRRKQKRKSARKRARKRKPRRLSRRSGPKPKPRLPGSKPGEPNESVRRTLTGRHPEHSTAAPSESAELKAMRQLDKVLFPPTAAPPTAPWSLAIKLPSPGPRLKASGLPVKAKPASKPKPASADKPAKDLSWLTKLKKPDFPVRYDPSVVRYLKFYRDKPRGRRWVASFVRKSGRYKVAIRKLLRKHKLPEDLLWLALVESAFNPTIHSHAGAAGLWQFMPATGRIYGLTVNRRVDERLDPERSTVAAIKHLKDLYRRFGSWELAFAAYNMGYGGLLASIRKYNTNNYWELRRLEAGLPYETALYVPKIMAIAIAARNCKVFGCDKVKLDAVAPFGDVGVDKVSVAPGVTLKQVAKASKVDLKRLTSLNPHVIGSRMPPQQQSTLPRKAWTVYVPSGKAAAIGSQLAGSGRTPKLSTHRVRWGETLGHIAARYSTSGGYLEQLNDLYRLESPRPGSVLFVPPKRTPKTDAQVLASATAPVVVVPNQVFSYKKRERVFYQAIFGDTIEDVARVCAVTPSEIKKWNHLDGRASLQNGMVLQLFVPKGARSADTLLLGANRVDVLTVATLPFFNHFVNRQGRKRIKVTAKRGDTWKQLSKRYGLSLGMLERINHRSRRSKLKAGDKVVVYAKKSRLAAKSSKRSSKAKRRRKAVPKRRTAKPRARKRPAGKRPAGKRPAGKRPAGKRPAGKRPAGKRPARK